MSLSTCEQISDELVAFLDDELGEADRRPVAAHVSSCLVCRREMERLTTVRTWVVGSARIEPSADFADRFWSRMEDEPVGTAPARHPVRSRRWILPVLAAAAALAVAFQSMTRLPASPTPTTVEQRIVKAPAAPAMKAKVAAAPQAKDETPELAAIDDLKPEDLPPALLEHPELFLRLPVVRRLETLEHFDAVRQEEHDADDGAG